MTKNNQSPKQPVSGLTKSIVIALQKFIWYLAHFWPIPAILVAPAFLSLGLLAPTFMADGYEDVGKAVYRILAPHNHQLPQRSYFLYSTDGGVATYSMAELVAEGADAADPESFLGNELIGFKTALNHRMVAIFATIFVGGLAWLALGRRPHFGAPWFLLFLIPLLLDGFSHLISESSSLAFREQNAWAACLTGHLFSTDFYEGSKMGSLNWVLRNLTGGIFGVGIVWYLFTSFDDFFNRIKRRLANPVSIKP